MVSVLLRSAVSLITLFNLEGATASSVAESRFDHREVPEKHGGVAQLGEHLPCTQGVKGSNPFISTTQQKLQGAKRTRSLRSRIWAHSSGG